MYRRNFSCVHRHGRQRWRHLVGDSDISLETLPHSSQVSDSCFSPTANPGDRPPTYRQILPLALPRCNDPTTTDSLTLAQQQAIRRWRTPRHPEYVTLARRTRTFYDRQWACEGKPSAESIAAAGFFCDGRSLKIFKSYISNFIYFRVSCSYLNFKLSNHPPPPLSFISDTPTPSWNSML